MKARWLHPKKSLGWYRDTKRAFDELPELVHVLRGEMSLVGPRPLPTKYLPRYSSRQARRHEVSGPVGQLLGRQHE